VPDQLNIGQKSNVPIVSFIHQDGYTFLESLSEKDKPWDKHRKNADIISNYYKQGGMDSHAERVSLCSQLLEFKLVPDKKTGQQRLKLSWLLLNSVGFAIVRSVSGDDRSVGRQKPTRIYQR
jgi:hypothetical protein